MTPRWNLQYLGQYHVLLVSSPLAYRAFNNAANSIGFKRTCNVACMESIEGGGIDGNSRNTRGSILVRPFRLATNTARFHTNGTHHHQRGNPPAMNDQSPLKHTHSPCLDGVYDYTLPISFHNTFRHIIRSVQPSRLEPYRGQLVGANWDRLRVGTSSSSSIIIFIFSLLFYILKFRLTSTSLCHSRPVFSDIVLQANMETHKYTRDHQQQESESASSSLINEDEDLPSGYIFESPTIVEQEASTLDRHIAMITDFLSIYRGTVHYKDLPQLYQCSKLVLDDCNYTTKKWGSTNSRVYDSIAMNTLVLTNCDTSSMTFDNKIPVFNTSAQLQKLLYKYLGPPLSSHCSSSSSSLSAAAAASPDYSDSFRPGNCEKEAKMRAAATQRRHSLLQELRSEVLSKHTYANRAQELTDILVTDFGLQSLSTPMPNPMSSKRGDGNGQEMPPDVSPIDVQSDPSQQKEHRKGVDTAKDTVDLCIGVRTMSDHVKSGWLEVLLRSLLIQTRALYHHHGIDIDKFRIHIVIVDTEYPLYSAANKYQLSILIDTVNSDFSDLCRCPSGSDHTGSNNGQTNEQIRIQCRRCIPPVRLLYDTLSSRPNTHLYSKYGLHRTPDNIQQFWQVSATSPSTTQDSDKSNMYGYDTTDALLGLFLRWSSSSATSTSIGNQYYDDIYCPHCSHMLMTNGDNMYNSAFLSSLYPCLHGGYTLCGWNFVTHHPRPSTQLSTISTRPSLYGLIKRDGNNNNKPNAMIRNTAVSWKPMRGHMDLGSFAARVDLIRKHQSK